MRNVLAVTLALLGLEQPVDGVRSKMHFRGSGSVEDALLSWGVQRGMTGIEKMKFAKFNYSGFMVRGMGATEDLESGDVLEIPQASLLTSLNNELNAGLFEDKMAEPRVQLLGLVAAHKELGDSSPFAPYLIELPSLEDFQGYHPFFTSDQLMEEYEGSPLVAMVRNRRQELDGLWQRWQSISMSGNPTSSLSASATAVSEDSFKWAYLNCLTRCFDTHWDVGGGKLVSVPGLVPVGDNCNTAAHPNVWWTFDRKDPQNPKLKFGALEHIPAGGEITIPYAGPEQHYPNDDFADEWGFSLSNNPFAVEAWGKNDTRCSDSKVSCKMPSDQSQPAQWHTLASLSREHCGIAAC